jgi:type VI secretion system secreted protein VgrG
MLEQASQDTRRLAVFTPFAPLANPGSPGQMTPALLLTRVKGTESLSCLFEFQLDMLSSDGSLDPREIVGRNITFLIRDHLGAQRYFNGYVSRFTNAGGTDDGNVYQATVVPWLWFLTQTRNCRIFQNRTAPQIIANVFQRLGFTNVDFSSLSGTYAEREYCVQYRESDFNFVSRLMEEEGIHYFFRHENGRHELVLADSNAVFQTIENADEIEMAAPDSTGDLAGQLTEWQHDHSFVSGRFAQTDFNFKTPSTSLMKTATSRVGVPGAESFEIYEYPGRYASGGVGEQLARIRMEQVEVAHNVVSGAGTYQTFAPGGRFSVRSHRTATEVGQEYLLTEVRHEAVLGDSYGAGTDNAADEFLYRNSFRCVPSGVTFRPQQLAVKPDVEGPQTAAITGPPGEQIHTDEHGRVKVQFPWDREGNRDEHSSCWLRVSQVHAGAGWGMMDLPRIGEEVIVSFLDGDPDRPIVKGRVYNGEVRVPFGLPAQKTRSGGKSNTHKGSGYNEFTADDTAGAEQIRVNAQYNMDTTIGNSETLSVGVDRTASVGNNDSLTVGVDSTADIGSNQTTIVGTDATYDVAGNITINAGTSITLKTGVSTIHMNQAGVITISGQFVSSLAKATNTIVAPMTEIAGSNMLNQAGLICLDLGGIKHIKGGETSISGATVNIKGGTTVIKGAPIEIGEVGAPMVEIPAPESGGGGSPGSGSGPGSADSSGSGSGSGEADSGPDGVAGDDSVQQGSGAGAEGGGDDSGLGDKGDESGDSGKGAGATPGPDGANQGFENEGNKDDFEDKVPGAAANGIKQGGEQIDKQQRVDADQAKADATRTADDLEGRAQDAEAKAESARQQEADAQRKVQETAQGSNAREHMDGQKAAHEFDQASQGKLKADLEAGQTRKAANQAADYAKSLPSGDSLSTPIGKLSKAAGYLGAAGDFVQLGVGAKNAYDQLQQGDRRGASVTAGETAGGIVGGGLGAWGGAAAGMLICGPPCAIAGGFIGGMGGDALGTAGGGAAAGAAYDYAAQSSVPPTASQPPTTSTTGQSVTLPSNTQPRCFAGDVLVSTPQGRKRICELSVGDEVNCFNADRRLTVSRISRMSEARVNRTLTIDVDGESITTTDAHKWFILKRNWQRAGSIEPGDHCCSTTGRAVAVHGVRTEHNTMLVYNLELDSHHNFFVGDREVLVHNGLRK